MRSPSVSTSLRVGRGGSSGVGTLVGQGPQKEVSLSAGLLLDTLGMWRAEQWVGQHPIDTMTGVLVRREDTGSPRT